MLLNDEDKKIMYKNPYPSRMWNKTRDNLNGIIIRDGRMFITNGHSILYRIKPIADIVDTYLVPFDVMKCATQITEEGADGAKCLKIHHKNHVIAVKTAKDSHLYPPDLQSIMCGDIWEPIPHDAQTERLTFNYAMLALGQDVLSVKIKNTTVHPTVIHTRTAIRIENALWGFLAMPLASRKR